MEAAATGAEFRTHVDCGPLRLDMAGFRLRHGTASVPLTVTEVRLLELLAREPGAIVSYDQLVRALPVRQERPALVTALCRLRERMAALGCKVAIRNVRRRGYVMVWDPA